MCSCSIEDHADRLIKSVDNNYESYGPVRKKLDKNRMIIYDYIGNSFDVELQKIKKFLNSRKRSSKAGRR